LEALTSCDLCGGDTSGDTNRRNVSFLGSSQASAQCVGDAAGGSAAVL
jgi:hypothetical protein